MATQVIEIDEVSWTDFLKVGGGESIGIMQGKIVSLFQNLRLIAAKVKVKVAQSCPTLCDPMFYTVCGILQARRLEWAAFPFSRGPSQPRDQTQVSRLVGRFFTSLATRESQESWSGQPIPPPGDLPDPGIKPGPPALQADSLPIELSGKPEASVKCVCKIKIQGGEGTAWRPQSPLELPRDAPERSRQRSHIKQAHTSEFHPGKKRPLLFVFTYR